MNSNYPVRVFIGIAAYNAEHNIQRLLTSLCAQVEQDFVIDTILVYSDCSSDTTVSLAKRLPDSRICVVAGEERKGFIGAVQYLLNESSADLTVLLNDDILISDNKFISYLVGGYASSKAGLLCGNPQPVRTSSFISRAINSSFNAYYNMALKIKNGQSMHTYDGKVMALSRDFKDTLNFPHDVRLTGNVDSYIYFYCVSQGFSYYFVKEAVSHYVSPATMKDYLRWFIRNNANEPLMAEQFGRLVDKESKKPRMIFTYFLFLEFLKNPLGCTFIFFKVQRT